MTDREDRSPLGDLSARLRRAQRSALDKQAMGAIRRELERLDTDSGDAGGPTPADGHTPDNNQA